MPNSPDPTQNFGKGMIIGAWILVLLLFAFFFQQWSKKEEVPHAVEMINEQGEKQTILKRNNNHQYVANGQINQVPVLFLLDTGATEIVIPENIAKKLHLSKGPRTTAITAGGSVEVYSTRIEECVIGHIVLHNLFAIINPRMEGEEVLLGMSALKKINFLQEDDTLILKAKQN